MLNKARILNLVVPVLPVLVATPLLLLSLGNGMLWRDEAETACLARNVLKYGLPLAKEGVNLVTTEAGRDIGPRGDYILSPPGQVYITALSFFLFGPSTQSARLPFALLALATLCLHLRLCRRYGSRWAAPLAVWALVICVPFYLYARQCRYYACSMFAAVAVVYAYLESERQGWKVRSYALAGLIGALLLAWYTHLVTFAVLFISVVSHLLLKGQGTLKKKIVWLLALVLPVAGGIGPWVQHSKMLSWIGGLQWLSWRGPVEAGVIYLGSIGNVFLLPLLAIGLTGHLLVPGYRKFVERSPLFQLAQWILVVGSLGFLMMGSLRLTWPWGRYLSSFVPLFATVVGELLAPLWRASKIVGLLVIFLCWMTNLPAWVLFAGVPPGSPLQEWNPTYHKGVKVWPIEYISSLLRPYQGPLEGIIGYITPRARPGDAVFIEFEAESLMFYTPLKVLRELPFPEPPRWVILRPQGGEHSIFTLVKGITTDSLARHRYFPTWWRTGLEDLRGSPLANRRYLREYVRRNRYRKITLPYLDGGMENYPELMAHRFDSRETDEGFTFVTLYERPQPAEPGETGKRKSLPY